jgi:hypothetical protein
MEAKREETQEQKDRRWYGAELMGTQCQCDRPKKPGFSLCFKCYNRLPPEYQRDLYRKLGNGYEAGYEAAVKWLTENED